MSPIPMSVIISKGKFLSAVGAKYASKIAPNNAIMNPLDFNEYRVLYYDYPAGINILRKKSRFH